MKLFRRHLGAARDGLDFLAQSAAGADGAADQAQPAHHRADLPHGDRDHRLLRRGSSGATRTPSCVGAVRRRSRCSRSSPSSACTTNNRAYLDAILDSLSADSDVAYAVIVDARREPRRATAHRRFARHGRAAGPAHRWARCPRRARSRPPISTIRGQRYVELIAPVGGTRAADRDGARPGDGRGRRNGGGGARRDRPRRRSATSGSA